MTENATASVTLRRLGPGDEGALARAAPEVLDDPADPDLARAFLADPSHLLVVALAGGEVVGQAQAVLHRRLGAPPEAYLDNLAVAPAHRRRRIARGLVAEVGGWARERGARALWVVTDRDNAPARALYAGLGGEEEQVVGLLVSLG